MALRELLADFRVKVSGLRGLQQANKSLNQAAATARQVDGRMGGLTGSLRQTGGAFTQVGRDASAGAKGLDLFSIKSLAVVYGVQRAIGGIVRLSDEYTTLQNRLAFVTESREEALDVEEKLFAIGQKNFQSIGDTAELFQRYKIATDDLGLSQDEVLDFTDRLQRATVLTAGSAAEAQGALVQLAQGIGTNFEAAGQELRSIQEQAPVLAGIIAKAAGGNASQLLKLAKEGKINAELVVRAVREAGTELDKAFIRRTPKFSDGLTIMGNGLVRFTGRIQNASGASETFGAITEGFLKVLNRVEKPLTELVSQVDLLRFALILAGVALAPFVAGWAAAAASALVAVAPFVLIALAIDDLVATFQGGDSVTRRFFDGLFGDGTTEAFVDGLTSAFESLWDTITVLIKGLSGDFTLDEFTAEFIKASSGIDDAVDSWWESVTRFNRDVLDAFTFLWSDVKTLALEAFDFLAQAVTDLIRKLPGGEAILGGLQKAAGVAGDLRKGLLEGQANLGRSALDAGGALLTSGLDAVRGFGAGLIPEPRTAGATSNSTTNTNTSVGNRSVTVNVQSAEPRQIAGAVDRVLESDRAAILARIP